MPLAKSLSRAAWRSALLLATSLAPVAAQAQEGDASDARLNDTITVTAQKREQSILDVPVAVSVVAGDLVDRAGLDALEDIATLVPSLSIGAANNPRSQGFLIRGVGQGGTGIGEPQTSVYVDGAFLGLRSQQFANLFDLERIEILKGPQGTLFGKNASAGIVQLVSRGPGDALEADAKVEYGNYGILNLNAGVGGPVTDWLGVRLAAFTKESDGFEENAFLGRDTGGREEFGGRVKLVADLMDTATFTFSADYSERDNECCDFSQRIAPDAVLTQTLLGIQLAGIANPSNYADLVDAAGDTNRTVFADSPAVVEQTDWGLNGTLDWNVVGDWNVTSVTAFRSHENFDSIDGDLTSDDAIFVDNGSEYESFQQEIRILSPQARRLRGIAGLWYFEADRTTLNQLTTGNLYNLAGPATAAPVESALIGLGFPQPVIDGLLAQLPDPLIGATNASGESEQDEWAIFGELTFDLTERVSVTGGLRYTDFETSSASGEFVDTTVASPIPDDLLPFLGGPQPSLIDSVDPFDEDSFSEDNVSYRANIEYKPSSDSLVYFSFANGYKPGSLRTQQVFDPATGETTEQLVRIESEEPQSFELGYKANIGDNLFLSAAAFRTAIENFQIRGFDAATFTFPVQNIDVTTQGLELDLIYEPIEGLTVTGGAAWIDASYDDGFIGQCTVPQQVAFDSDASNGPDDVCTQDLSGGRLEAPEFSITGAFSYERPILNGQFKGIVGGEATYDSERIYDSLQDPNTEEDGYTLVNGRIGVGAADDRWQLELWAKNIFDTDYATIITDSPAPPSALFESILGTPPASSGYMHRLGPPRTYGVRFRVRYD